MSKTATAALRPAADADRRKRRPYNAALIVLDPDILAFRGLAADDPRLEAEVQGAVAHANAELSRVEQIKRVKVVDGDWEPGGELLTSTLKLKRKPIAERYADTIEELYA